ncbi:MAG: ABC transporter ATP-binding protein [Eubacterium sp.]|nr:ABC transporter ATP-binding protein [Eubacterium sp.]
MSLLEIKNLEIRFNTDAGVVHAVNGINLTIEEGESFGLVGETGAGKTTTALAILNLLQSPPAEIVSGEIIYKGQDILKLSKNKLRELRGEEISMIFQDPMTSLNPVMTIGEQIMEAVKYHSGKSAADAQLRMLEMLEKVRIPAERSYDYPHQFSGGMKQRVVIAEALAANPALLLADEPTTALDVTIQAQVLDMISSLQKENKTAMLLITHDLGVVAETCKRAAIMYAGEIVEMGTVEQIFDDTAHPYTKGLFNSIPSLDKKTDRLMPIRGLMPDPMDLPKGCKFCPRCPYADELCITECPPVKDLGDGHLCKCHHADKGAPLYFPDEKGNELAYEHGLPVSNPGNDFLGKGDGPDGE